MFGVQRDFKSRNWVKCLEEERIVPWSVKEYIVRDGEWLSVSV